MMLLLGESWLDGMQPVSSVLKKARRRGFLCDIRLLEKNVPALAFRDKRQAAFTRFFELQSVGKPCCFPIVMYYFYCSLSLVQTVRTEMVSPFGSY